MKQSSRLLAIAVIGFVILLRSFGHAERSDNLSPSVNSFSSAARHVALQTPVTLETPAVSQLVRVRKLLSQTTGRRVLSPSQCIHLLAAFGENVELKDSSGQAVSVLELLIHATSGEEYFGRPFVLATPYGASAASAYESRSVSEAHNDQLISCLALLELPLETEVRTNVGAQCLLDLLNDSVANLNLDRKELEFTAIAYAVYLKSGATLRNKFGEQFTLDDIVFELIGRGCADSHCCGIHVLEALFLIESFCGQGNLIVRSDTQESLRSFKHEAITHILSQQSSDGSWTPDWFVGLNGQASGKQRSSSFAWAIEQKMLATSHIIQLLSQVDATRQPIETEVYRRGLEWLNIALQRVDKEFALRNYCQVSHSCLCIRRFSEDEGGL